MQLAKTVEGRSIHWAEAASIFYLIAPTFLFFAFFIRIAVAVPACIFLGLCAYDLFRKTRWHDLPTTCRLSIFYACVAALWVWLSGGIGPLHQNGDWAKHYSVLNFLVNKQWPPIAPIQGLGDAALRYSIGWYLVPAIALKISEPSAQNAALSLWTVVGLFLFFSLLPALNDSKRGAIITPIVFIVFGGADALGTLITGYQHGPPHHFQWWSGWIEYPANTTSLFWVPQHAIPSWLGIALLIRQLRLPTILPYLALLFAAISLWSPFAVMGLAPFAAVLLGKYGWRKIVFDWRPVAAVLLLALPTFGYLLAGSEAVPHGLIWEHPCTFEDGACFTWPSYFLFLLIEVGAPIAILFFSRDNNHALLWVAAISLVVIPLYRIGVTNDFSMRASIPALCVIAILAANSLTGKSRLFKIAVLIVLLAGAPTAIGEMLRGIQRGPDIAQNTTFSDPWATRYFDQYFAPSTIWVLRQ